MDNWNIRTFRNDLSIFIDLIDEKITGDFSELGTLLDSLEDKELIEYEFKNLAFHINGRIAGTQPDNLNFCQINLDNMLMAKDNLNNTTDPLYGYYLDINIAVYKSQSSTMKAYNSSWHLDRHPDTTNVKYTHPTYHFQFGGKKMELIDEDMSVLSCPRIPHPPMDIFLAFHFIISNYYSKRAFPLVTELKETFEYQEIIKRAQERLWTPYFKAFDPSHSHNDFTIQNIFPLYIN